MQIITVYGVSDRRSILSAMSLKIDEVAKKFRISDNTFKIFPDDMCKCSGTGGPVIVVQVSGANEKIVRMLVAELKKHENFKNTTGTIHIE
ncbi:MAG: hypothetical protein WCF94_02065 [bacterium]